MATAGDVWQVFRHWRRRRPFWGALLLVLAGLELFLSANLSLGDMEVHVGPQGFLSYLLPLIVLLSGLLSWFTPGQRLFYGVLGLLTALYSLIGLNLGGFFAGMLIGIVGGALTIAWAPARPSPAGTAAAAAAAAAVSATGEPAPAGTADTAGTAGTAGTAVIDPGPVPTEDETRDDAVAYSDDPPTQFLPGFSGEGQEPQPPSTGRAHHKLLVITLVPVAVTAAMLAAGSHTPARADNDCPDGLPSRPATASASASENAARRKAAVPKRTTTAPKKTSSAPHTSVAPAPSVSSSPGSDSDDDEESDHPLLDGIQNGVHDIVTGIGKVLGIGDDEPSPSPSPSSSPSPSASPSHPVPAPSPSANDPATGPTGRPQPSQPAGTGRDEPAGTASPSPTPSLPDIPCLGPRVLNKTASPDDIPVVSLDGATLEGQSLTMYNSTYDGVTSLSTGNGTLQALKFSMTKSVTKPFKLTVPEAGGHTTMIKSDQLTTDGNVRFYTPRFEGKLFGLIPVTFTPEQPPPLTLPVLWFTDVKIHLAFVRCDTLTADPLDLSEKS